MPFDLKINNQTHSLTQSFKSLESLHQFIKQKFKPAGPYTLEYQDSHENKLLVLFESDYISLLEEEHKSAKVILSLIFENGVILGKLRKLLKELCKEDLSAEERENIEGKIKEYQVGWSQKEKEQFVKVRALFMTLYPQKLAEKKAEKGIKQKEEVQEDEMKYSTNTIKKAVTIQDVVPQRKFPELLEFVSKNKNLPVDELCELLLTS